MRVEASPYSNWKTAVVPACVICGTSFDAVLPLTDQSRGLLRGCVYARRSCLDHHVLMHGLGTQREVHHPALRRHQLNSLALLRCETKVRNRDRIGSHGTDGATKRPSPPAISVRECPVSVWRDITVALLCAEPLGSWTTPLMVPPTIWARTGRRLLQW